MKTLLPLLLCTLPLVSAASDVPPDTDAHAAFAEAVSACTAATHETPHPFVRGFTIQHTVVGKDGDACKYSQTMPGDMRMECRLGEEGQAALAHEYHELAAGRMSGGTSSKPARMDDCEIVDKAGTRSKLQ